MDSLLIELRLGIRRLRRDLLLTTTAIVSLAIGIGANTAIYTVARALLFRPQPGIAAPGALVDIGRTDQGGFGFNPLSYRDYTELRTRVTTLGAVYAYNMFPNAMSLGADGRDRLFTTIVSSNYFTALGVVPAAGRLLQAADGEALAAQPVIVISDDTWARLFNRDPSTVGRALIVNGQSATIAGVTPAGFHGTGVRSADAWLTIGALQSPDTAKLLTSDDGSWLMIGGRRRPGASVAQVTAEVAAIAHTLPSSVRDPGRGLRATTASPVPGAAAPMFTFMGLLVAIVGLVLAVACANVSGMLLARVPARRREMALRAAIGATRRQLTRQLLVETVLLFLVSAGAGLWVARMLTHAVLALLPALPFPVDLGLAIDLRAVTFTTVLALAAALFAGLAPATQAARVDLVAALNADRDARPRMRLRRIFVVGQVALSLVLVIVGGLFARAMLHAGAADPGFDAHGTDLVTIGLPTSADRRQVNDGALDAVLDRIRSLPGIDRVSAASAFPGGFEEMRLGTLRVPGSTADVSGEWNVVMPGYFQTIRMPLLAGRDFSMADRAGTPAVAIIGAGTARRLWPGRAPGSVVGQVVEQQRFNPATRTTDVTPVTIVGVSGDPAYGTLVDGSTDVHIYVPFAQLPMPRMMIVVRTVDGRSVVNEVRSAVGSTSLNVTVESTRSGEEYSMLGLMPQRVGSYVTASLGLVGLLLAAIGVYGVTAHAVTRRTREIGIRLALGAPMPVITRLILREGLSLVAAGGAIGLPVAFGAAQLLSGYLAGLPAADPVTFWGTAALFTAMGLLACSAPLARARRISPTDILRAD